MQDVTRMISSRKLGYVIFNMYCFVMHIYIACFFLNVLEALRKAFLVGGIKIHISGLICLIISVVTKLRDSFAHRYNMSKMF